VALRHRDQPGPPACQERNVAIKDFQGYAADQTFTSDLRLEAIVTEQGRRP
jgi:hypothetical protein